MSPSVYDRRDPILGDRIYPKHIQLGKREFWMKQSKTSHNHKHHGPHRLRKETILRLKRGHGHLGKVIQMLEDDQGCLEILQQLSAVLSALGASRTLIINDHLDSCLRPTLKAGNESVISEIQEIIGRTTKVKL
jgi:CsoR family transcriptional regulator, copper-sensing transcriptional repressor